MNYPKAKEEPISICMHGQTIDDPYQWMREQSDPQLLAWVKQENELTDQFFQKHADIYKTYEQRNKNHKEHASYSNIVKSPNGYTMTRIENGAYRLIEVNEAFEEVRDFSKLLKTVEHTTFFSGAICPNDAQLAYFLGLIDGYDRPSVFLFNLVEQRCITHIDGIFDCMFDPNGKRLLFGDACVEKENKRTINHLKRYDFETQETICLFTYPENAIMVCAKFDESGQQLVADVTVDYSRHQLYFETPQGFVAYHEKPECVQYCGSLKGNHIILSFEENKHGQLFQVSSDLHTQTLLFEDHDIFIQQAKVLDDEIYLFAMKDVDSVVYRFHDGKCQPFEISTHASATLLSGFEAHQDALFLLVESFVQPPMLYRIRQGVLESLADKKAVNLPIEVSKVFYESKDGTKIPAYLIYRKDHDPNKPLPTLMYGYGGYNVPSLPSFHNPFVGLDIVDWVMDGGLYVNCCIRGGNEYGETWHTQGYKLKKKNCYYDFIAIAEGIIKDGWTIPQKIGICGGSNGGLLVCALLTMRPDLWGCVIASVPHSDMLSFAKDDRGPMYITEYGDPDDEEQFHYFLSYSPFHNIQRVAYPPVYIQTGECDNNVPPYHGKKMAARLQQYNTSKHPILLRVLEKGSHDRGKGDVYTQTVSEMQAFLHLALHKEEKE
ncbi:MAG: S9 family peptidase [Erysipelotrichaceae bacterium]|nr:S9 family peptidase [Erysipelotrichaceae bacterium]